MMTKYLIGFILNILNSGVSLFARIDHLSKVSRKASAGAVFNNAGQIMNHELYFMQFKPASEAAQDPQGALVAQIEKQ